MSAYTLRVNRARWLRTLQRKVAHLLLTEWDPIGVYPGGPRDEYDVYAARVCSLLARGASQTEVTDYLHKAAQEQMGLEGPPAEGLGRKLLQLLEP